MNTFRAACWWLLVCSNFEEEVLVKKRTCEAEARGINLMMIMVEWNGMEERMGGGCGGGMWEMCERCRGGVSLKR